MKEEWSDTLLIPCGFMTSVQGMGTIAAKYWWLLLVRGILLIVLGIMMLAWPNATITVFAVLFAAFLFVDGVLEIVQGFQDRKVGQPSAGNFTLGALAIIFGLIVLFWPRGVLTAIVILIAIWAILAAVAGISAGIRLRKVSGSGWGWFLAFGILAGIFGISLIVNPSAGISTLVWLVGFWAIVTGIMLAAFSFVVRKVGNAIVDAPPA
jgi:uncharacterized membrane protein HdeD (DUF308 family)